METATTRIWLQLILGSYLDIFSRYFGVYYDAEYQDCCNEANEAFDNLLHYSTFDYESFLTEFAEKIYVPWVMKLLRKHDLISESMTDEDIDCFDVSSSSDFVTVGFEISTEKLQAIYAKLILDSNQAEIVNFIDDDIRKNHNTGKILNGYALEGYKDWGDIKECSESEIDSFFEAITTFCIRSNDAIYEILEELSDFISCNLCEHYDENDKETSLILEKLWFYGHSNWIDSGYNLFTNFLKEDFFVFCKKQGLHPDATNVSFDLPYSEDAEFSEEYREIVLVQGGDRRTIGYIYLETGDVFSVIRNGIVGGQTFINIFKQDTLIPDGECWRGNWREVAEAEFCSPYFRLIQFLKKDIEYLEWNIENFPTLPMPLEEKRRLLSQKGRDISFEFEDVEDEGLKEIILVRDGDRATIGFVSKGSKESPYSKGAILNEDGLLTDYYIDDLDSDDLNGKRWKGEWD